MNHILQEDIEYIAMSKSIEWKELENKKCFGDGSHRIDWFSNYHGA